MYQTQRNASEVVAAVLDGRNLTDTLNALWRRQPTLEPRQRAAIQDISYGTLRRLGEIRHALDRLLSRQLDEPLLYSLLATGIYQLGWGRAAPYAVVDHAVRVAAQIGTGRAKGLVNAVLRNYLRQREQLAAQAATDAVARWNHPQWWIRAMQRHYPERWEAILEANNQHPPMSLRINRRRGTPADYLARLTEAGIEAQLVGESGVRLVEPVGVDRLPGFQDGDCSVQDLGAQWAAPLLNVSDGMRVLDACAAPGGKTGHLLELADLDLTALDLDRLRLDRVASNLSRLGCSAKLAVGDAARPADWWDGQPFDRILADVPCSASGVVRRHPDIKWLRRPDDFGRFAAQQAAMLDALWGCLKPGGQLLYVTCSVFPQENSEQIDAFLQRQPEARRLPLSSLPADGQCLPDAAGDGFFYALLEKKS
ncbi:16S rRNA (cytosine(967)-C(5))-methyltransferase RsmB [Chitinimonas lacunae]|uniref:16S rRNA (cytosine(967)-C(5))-methyltransferase n=1 Tax=Chitinimonas lacunae TaxID=1963018 RepID=A0ABV8MRQ8_9NEIS